MKLKLVAPIIISLLLTLATIATAASCGGGTPANSDKLGVAVTLLPFADFVENIGGDRVEVTVMVPPGASPHSYEPTPSQMVALSKAEAYFKVGSGIEFELTWMDNLIAQNPDMSIVDCSDGIALLEGGDEHEGDDHGGTDPHIWNSPANVKIIAVNILDGLIAADPENEDYYQTNAEAYLDEMDDLDAYISSALDGFENRRFLIYHPSFGYFAGAYGLEQIAIEQEGKEPTPQTIQSSIDLAEQYNLDYVFVEPQFTAQYAETIADAIGGETALIDPLPERYIDNMRSVVDAIALELE
ncbi:MAG: zinc ABC transporter substrate-binding protein [Chloroflexota bacterium]|nr:zinc ABC transporter substrate-binding protein [Chloroflexota bacterium]